MGCSDFARHYFRNHGCFLFLRVLRWFTSPGSLEPTMYSLARNRCTHLLGSPIRTSPDLRLLASPRGFSQLATSFFAYLRLGIPTHALSSLTIKLTSYTVFFREDRSPSNFRLNELQRATFTCVSMPVRYSIVKDRLLLRHFFSGLLRLLLFPAGAASCCSLDAESRLEKPAQDNILPHTERTQFPGSWWAWVDSNYRPHPYQGCALTT